MDDAGRMDRSERLGQPPTEDGQPGGGQGTLVLDHGVQARPGHEPGDDVRLVSIDVGVQHLGDQRVPHAQQARDLALQPGTGVRVVGDMCAQHLDRHRPPGPVEPEVDDPHAALAQAVQQPVGTEVAHLGRYPVTRRRPRHGATLREEGQLLR